MCLKQFKMSILEDQIRNYLKDKTIPNPLFVDFTLKQKIEFQSKFGTYLVDLDQYGITTNFRHFSNRLNRKVYGKSFHRYGKRLKMIVVEEGGKNEVRLHQHTVIETPSHLDQHQFKTLISDIWTSHTLWGYENIHFGVPDKFKGDVSGWINYITKSKTKSRDLSSSIDWENTYLV